MNENFVITVTSDDIYFDKLIVFLKSLYYTNDIDTIVTLVNINKSKQEIIKKISNRITLKLINKKLSNKVIGLKNDNKWQWVDLKNIKKNNFTYTEKSAFCNNIRFKSILNSLHLNYDFIINMDIDQIFINKINLNDFFNKHDFYIFDESKDFKSLKERDLKNLNPEKTWVPESWLDKKTKIEKTLTDESFICIKNNDKIKNFFKEADNLIRNDFLNWDADFYILNNLYKKYKNEISFDTIYLEFNDRWFFDEDSFIWNGAAEIKTNNRIYIDKYEKYIC
jgi:hypothetical protein